MPQPSDPAQQVEHSLGILLIVTFGAPIGFGIGSIIRRHGQPVATEHEGPIVSPAP